MADETTHPPDDDKDQTTGAPTATAPTSSRAARPLQAQSALLPTDLPMPSTPTQKHPPTRHATPPGNITPDGTPIRAPRPKSVGLTKRLWENRAAGTYYDPDFEQKAHVTPRSPSRRARMMQRSRSEPPFDASPPRDAVEPLSEARREFLMGKRHFTPRSRARLRDSASRESANRMREEVHNTGEQGDEKTSHRSRSGSRSTVLSNNSDAVHGLEAIQQLADVMRRTSDPDVGGAIAEAIGSICTKKLEKNTVSDRSYSRTTRSSVTGGRRSSPLRRSRSRSPQRQLQFADRDDFNGPQFGEEEFENSRDRVDMHDWDDIGINRGNENDILTDEQQHSPPRRPAPRRRILQHMVQQQRQQHLAQHIDEDGINEPLPELDDVDSDNLPTALERSPSPDRVPLAAAAPLPAPIPQPVPIQPAVVALLNRGNPVTIHSMDSFCYHGVPNWLAYDQPSQQHLLQALNEVATLVCAIMWEVLKIKGKRKPLAKDLEDSWRITELLRMMDTQNNVWFKPNLKTLPQVSISRETWLNIATRCRASWGKTFGKGLLLPANSILYEFVTFRNTVLESKFGVKPQYSLHEHEEATARARELASLGASAPSI